ncbi:nitroreductase family protein [Oceanirhabdus sp. W0125-5]|uniref:nitroreductase family protein n=1 Tax=Oceanirhabdus sp. W0125-5 TaxID=2999116 RepID=UPI0022F2EF53|nr:nitroreductase family protein [Oceanirhabdus sp. W0125-5]WBW97835.1 nitroreductase family protein [Oceanirhabdus sp. W0125-5]
MINELLKKRCSVRNFSTEKVPSETIDYILEAGRLSPSGGNEQPWKFGVIKDKSLIKTISKICYNQKWIESADFLVVLCATIVDEEKGGMFIQHSRCPELKETISKLPKELYSKINLEEHQTKIPGSHMVLAALEKGVYSTWISYFNVEELKTLLNLPDNFYPSEILAFGYPQGTLKTTSKKPLDEIVFYDSYSL